MKVDGKDPLETLLWTKADAWWSSQYPEDPRSDEWFEYVSSYLDNTPREEWNVADFEEYLSVFEASDDE